jgi:membrane protein implicated in regulation of membrane protease activity
MRKVAIIGALLLGILGLFMSVCGGGFFVMFAYSAIRALLQPIPTPAQFGMLPFMALAAAFAVGGAISAWSCFRYVRKRMAERERGKS